MTRRVIRDSDGEPTTLRDVGPIDPATGCGGCGRDDCWACRSAAAFAAEFAARNHQDPHLKETA